MAKPTKRRTKAKTPKKSTPIHHLTALPQWQRLLLWAMVLVMVLCAFAMMMVQPIAGVLWLIAGILLAPPVISRLRWRVLTHMATSLVLTVLGLIVSVIVGNREHNPTATLDTSAQIASQAQAIATQRAKQAADSISDGMSDGILLGANADGKESNQSTAKTTKQDNSLSNSIRDVIKDISAPITEPIIKLQRSVQTLSDQLTKLGGSTSSTQPSGSADTQSNPPDDTNAITCRIVGISDGDTATCLDKQNQQLKIRFAQIDAPEKGQDFGQAAKRQLSELIFDRQVALAVHDKDRYGRTVAEVFVDGKNVNKLMVATGYAWAYRAYMTDSDYLLLETQAKSQGIGLWSAPNPIYPEDYRKAKKTN